MPRAGLRAGPGRGDAHRQCPLRPPCRRRVSSGPPTPEQAPRPARSVYGSSAQLKFQLLHGHPALCPAHGPGPKSQPCQRRPRGDQTPRPASQSRGLRIRQRVRPGSHRALGRGHQLASGTRAPPSARPSSRSAGATPYGVRAGPDPPSPRGGRREKGGREGGRKRWCPVPRGGTNTCTSFTPAPPSGHRKWL